MLKKIREIIWGIVELAATIDPLFECAIPMMLGAAIVLITLFLFVR